MLESRSGETNRRYILTGAAWSAPVLAAAAAAPLAAASTTGGTLYLHGSAWGTAGIFFTGSNFNGFGMQGDYAPGSVKMTIVLPEGVTFTHQEPSEWLATVSGNVFTVTNLVTITHDHESGDLGNLTILGNFPRGSEFRIEVTPNTITTVMDAALASGIFA